MSTPRPTEADMEWVRGVLNDSRFGASITRREELVDVIARRFAARDAERHREVAYVVHRLSETRAERDEWQDATETAGRDRDEARRELADLRAKVVGLHGGIHWCFDANEDEVVFQPDTQWWPCPTYALLPTEDDQ